MSGNESVLALFATDKSAESGGKWITVGPAKFLLARMGGSNQKFQRAMSSIMKPHARRLQLGAMDEREAEDLMLDAFVGTVLLDWKGVRDMVKDEATGKMVAGPEIPFSEAKRILKDERDLYAFLREEATKLSNFAQEFVDNAVGN